MQKGGYAKFWHHIFLLSILLLFAVAISGCGGGSSGGGGDGAATPDPGKTIESYSSAVEGGDTEKALENVSQDSQERQQRILESLDEDSRQRLAKALENATIIYEDENVIEYKGTMELSDGSTVEDTFRLVLEDGKWKLTGL